MRRKTFEQPLIGKLSAGGADVSGVTATAGDVDEGKIFVDSSGEEVEGTSTYKADYTALSQSVNTINNNLETAITGSGSGGGLTVDSVKGLIDGTGTSFTIPNGATNIRQYKFYEMANLASVDIPNTVTSIGDCAFQNCTNLALTSLPSSITSVGDSAFEGCTSLALTSLPSGLTNLGVRAFRNCSNVALTELPSGITNLSERAFANCVNLSITDIPSNVTTIGNNALGGCTRLTSITFHSKPTSIDVNTFNYCSNLAIIYVPWSQGEVAGAPWGAVNATLVYDHTP